jgi:hypothetical protein
MGGTCWLVGIAAVMRRPLLVSRDKRDIPLSLGLVGALLAFPVCSTAQITASLIGTVSDESGAVIPGATISIRQTATNRERTTQTNDAGRYQIAALDVGDYQVTVRAPGFKTQVVEASAAGGGPDCHPGFRAFDW